jgi:hypothetical protein
MPHWVLDCIDRVGWAGTVLVALIPAAVVLGLFAAPSSFHSPDHPSDPKRSRVLLLSALGLVVTWLLLTVVAVIDARLRVRGAVQLDRTGQTGEWVLPMVDREACTLRLASLSLLFVGPLAAASAGLVGAARLRSRRLPAHAPLVAGLVGAVAVGLLARAALAASDEIFPLERPSFWFSRDEAKYVGHALFRRAGETALPWVRAALAVLAVGAVPLVVALRTAVRQAVHPRRTTVSAAAALLVAGLALFLATHDAEGPRDPYADASPIPSLGPARRATDPPPARTPPTDEELARAIDAMYADRFDRRPAETEPVDPHAAP